MFQSVSWEAITLLVTSGIVVGFINTLAGGAAIISLTTFMVLGLPLHLANGTNRIPTFFENLTASANFLRNRRLNVRVGLKLAIPAIVGNILGSQVAVTVDEQVIKICLGAILVAILVFMAFSTEKRIKRNAGQGLRIRYIDYFWFLLIGFYGGYIYVGIGYMILAVTLMSMRMDLMTANAIKGFVLMVSLPFSMVVFMMNGEVNYTFGFIHAAGNVLGAFLASQYAVGWRINYLRLFLATVIIFCLAEITGLISLHDIITSII